jgi:hypothetical protein
MHKRRKIKRVAILRNIMKIKIRKFYGILRAIFENFDLIILGIFFALNCNGETTINNITINYNHFIEIKEDLKDTSKLWPKHYVWSLLI